MQQTSGGRGFGRRWLIPGVVAVVAAVGGVLVGLALVGFDVVPGGAEDVSSPLP
ncbi:MAG TPA: hypothetical protein VK923_13220 [Euzebyales bacterium]|nr:hypothetical protein [Euzebyales bacterium]